MINWCWPCSSEDKQLVNKEKSTRIQKSSHKTIFLWSLDVAQAQGYFLKSPSPPLHSIWFIRNTSKFQVVLFLNFYRNLSSSVAYLLLNFSAILDSVFLRIVTKLVLRVVKCIKKFTLTLIHKILYLSHCNLASKMLYAKANKRKMFLMLTSSCMFLRRRCMTVA